MGKTCKNLRKQWRYENLGPALQAIRAGESQRNASKRFKIPRRTLRRYLKNGEKQKNLGRPSILSHGQELDFVSRIKRYCEVGLPLTPTLVRHQVYRFCENNGIIHNFNKEKQTAGKDWLRSFLRRQHDLSKRKAQACTCAETKQANSFRLFRKTKYHYGRFRYKK